MFARKTYFNSDDLAVSLCPICPREALSIEGVIDRVRRAFASDIKR